MENSLGSDIKKYQKWVDYDMKRYGKISDKTQAELDKAGLQVVKDQYGDYEVTAGSYAAESKKVSVMESLTEKDIEELSEMSFTEDELSHILSLFELISDENKDKAFGIIKSLFEGKKLVSDEEKVEEKVNRCAKKNTISERYTKILLGDK